MMVRAISFAVVFCFASAVQAQEARPAPDYFVDSVMATTTAQQLAVACPTLSFNIIAASRATGPVMERLIEDGFDPDQLESQMTGFAEAMAARQAAFLARHDLSDGAESEKVCAVGAAEIAEGSDIGSFLTKVAAE